MKVARSNHKLVSGSQVSDMVAKHVPQAEMLNDVGSELSFRLPFEATSRFVELFSELDANKLALNIAQYGISVTTLEEV